MSNVSSKLTFFHHIVFYIFFYIHFQLAKMEETNRKDLAIARASREKERLKDLVECKKRPQLDELPDGSEVYALNIQFTKKWRSFLE